jgi:hypothetical protein
MKHKPAADCAAVHGLDPVQVMAGGGSQGGTVRPQAAVALATAAAEKVIVTLDPQNPARDRITVRPAPVSESKITHPNSNIP